MGNLGFQLYSIYSYQWNEFSNSIYEDMSLRCLTEGGRTSVKVCDWLNEKHKKKGTPELNFLASWPCMQCD